MGEKALKSLLILAPLGVDVYKHLSNLHNLFGQPSLTL